MNQDSKLNEVLKYMQNICVCVYMYIYSYISNGLQQKTYWNETALRKKTSVEEKSALEKS